MTINNEIKSKFQDLEAKKNSTDIAEYCKQLESLLSDSIKTIDSAINNTVDNDILNKIAENTISGIYIYHLEDVNNDRSLKMVYANPASEKLTGVTCNNVIGKTLDENFPGLREKGIPQNYAKVVRTGQTYEVEDLYYNDDLVIEGAFLVKAFPLPYNHVGVTFENIIELKKSQKQIELNNILLQEQNEEFQVLNEELGENNQRIREYNDILSQNEAYQKSIFRSAPIGIGVVKNRHFNFVNEFLCNMLGYTKEEMLGKSARLLYPSDEEFERVGQEKYEQIKNEGSGTIETVFQTKEKKLLDVILSSTPIDNEDWSKGITFSAMDITDRKLAEIELKRIFEVSADLICIASLDAYFKKVNPSFKRILGYDEEELVNKPVYDFIHPDDIQITKDIVSEKLKNGEQVINFQNRYKCKNGEYKWLEWTSQPILEENTTYAIARDITEIKQTQEELSENKEKLEEAQSIGKIGHYSMDVPNNTWTCSKTLDEIFGNADDEIRNLDLWIKLLHPDDREMMLNYFTKEVIGKQKPFDKEYRIINIKTQKEKWVHGKGKLKIDDQGIVISMFGTIQDITKRKHIELKILEKEKSLKEKNEEYQALNEELHAANNKMYHINQELKAAKMKAEESDHLKTAFLANMSHEIRTPMNGIIGFSNLLSDESLTSDKRQHYIDIINNSAKHLLTIISDIIDIAKIEAGQVDIVIKNFELNPLLLELKEQFETEKLRKEKYNIDLICNIPSENIEIVSDEIRIKQILANLLSNALKFTQRGYIKYGYYQKNDQVVFFVEDSGKGISQENVEIIFNRFRQEDDSNIREFGGTGLGLSISKALVEKLGGRIWVESEKDTGSKFFFSVDSNAITNRNEMTIPISEIDDAPDWKGKTILLVEDMEVTQILVNEIIEPTGADLIISDSGKEAIKICKEKKPDIILMDIQLPDINGYDATTKIREFDKTTPIIAQTAYAMSGDDLKAIDAGCSDYITKPYKRLKLLNMMNKYLNNS